MLGQWCSYTKHQTNYVNSCYLVGKLELVTVFILLNHPTCIVPFRWRKNLGVRLIFYISLQLSTLQTGSTPVAHNARASVEQRDTPNHSTIIIISFPCIIMCMHTTPFITETYHFVARLLHDPTSCC